MLVNNDFLPMASDALPPNWKLGLKICVNNLDFNVEIS